MVTYEKSQGQNTKGHRYHTSNLPETLLAYIGKGFARESYFKAQCICNMFF